MAFKLPDLPYALDALNPYISKQTLEFHHGKHHLTYINNLNKQIEGTKFEQATLETMIQEAEGGIFNNAAQTFNHTFYFESFSPKPKKTPEGKLAEALRRDFGNVEKFVEAFTQGATALFGSGWAWLAADKSGKLCLKMLSNAGNPLREGLVPLLTCDVWEHAYYLDCQNRRADYIKNFWQVLDWSVVEKRYAAL